MQNKNFRAKRLYTRQQSIIQTVQRKYKNIFKEDIPNDVIYCLLKMINIDKQIYIKYYIVDSSLDLTNIVSRGYKSRDASTTRFIPTVLLGEVSLGYTQNKKVLRKTVLKSRYAVVHLTCLTQGVVSNSFSTKSEDYLIFLKMR